MANRYTKKQIREAIQYWKNRLKALDESVLIGNGLQPFTVTLMREQTCELKVMADSEDEAREVVQELVDNGDIGNYVEDEDWVFSAIDVGAAEPEDA